MRRYLKAFICFAVVLMIGAASKPSFSDDNKVTVDEVKKMIDEKEDVFLLDVRTVGEYKMSHIKGTYRVHVDDVSKRLKDIPKDKDVIVLCAVGGRSAVATERLLNNGYTRVFDMLGGMREWEKKGYPVVKQDK
jgi:rhodanese-related sulfurtransferase